MNLTEVKFRLNKVNVLYKVTFGFKQIKHMDRSGIIILFFILCFQGAKLQKTF